MVMIGAEMLLHAHRQRIAGKQLGLVSNYNVTDSALRPIVELLVEEREWHVAKLFGPEHGMLNCAKEGEEVPSASDPHTGLPTYSLYGDTLQPTPEMLAGLDALVIDVPDIGSRYYTNMNTMAYCLLACAQNGLECIVLDRPNPIGGVIREGNIPDKNFHSFVGMIDIPNRHGLTMGEIAMLYNQTLPVPALLTVIRCEGWERSMWQGETGIPFVSPSPNTTNLDMVALYPGTCLFEGTNISEGRGTTHPFEMIGAPFIHAFELADAVNERNLPGVVARPTFFVPTYKKYPGDLCEGIQLHITNQRALRPLQLGLTLIDVICKLYDEHFTFTHKDEEGRYFFDLLAGTDRLRNLVNAGKTLDFLAECDESVQSFDKGLADILLY
ncbi:DUF1343 domain-containing protein [Alicyclobacillus fastidiosus]|uniref:DUF1343 domain-containing protein n=1 Tax=Alicyclobacillus fastidiosus TaxID=392011 RepID=A0ABY6ZJD4_9BACL|nr:DUF1343 domain-containing protein [Alicyclobacillus fastidiosus]WAH43033.1 DUF1343 domain-containing protein [Alicyclobacillus fastidiosus]GMA65013.1 hypothetical protein GCM10025859_54530 [Alicyclobacillus fastidiosus]